MLEALFLERTAMGVLISDSAYPDDRGHPFRGVRATVGAKRRWVMTGCSKSPNSVGTGARIRSESLLEFGRCYAWAHDTRLAVGNRAQGPCLYNEPNEQLFLP